MKQHDISDLTNIQIRDAVSDILANQSSIDRAHPLLIEKQNL